MTTIAVKPAAMNPTERFRRPLQWLFGTLLLAFALYAFLSIVSYTPGEDPEMVYQDTAVPADNLGGRLGVRLAHFLIMNLGGTSFLLTILGAVMGMMIVADRTGSDFWTRLIGAVILIITSCILENFILNPAQAYRGVTAPGGITGLFLNQRITQDLGRAGTIIFTTLLFFLSLYLVLGHIFIAGLKRFGGVWTHGSQSAVIVWRNLQAIRADRHAAGHVVEANKRKPEQDRPVPATPVAHAPRKARQAGGKNGLLKKIRSTRQTTKKAPAKEKTTVTETPAVQAVRPASHGYTLPSEELLDAPLRKTSSMHEEAFAIKNSDILQETLQDFHVDCKVVAYEQGPVVTMYEIELGPGVKVGKIASLSDDIAIALKTPNVRIVAPLPGKSTIGIEVPNLHQETIRLRTLIEHKTAQHRKYKIPLYLGSDASGKSVVSDLTEMPHLLIAGTTGSGKSVCINTILLSILLDKTPEEVKLILVDPKMVEMTAYKGIPHLRTEVVTDMKKSADALARVCKEMDDRYILLSRIGVKNILELNKLGEKEVLRRWRKNPESAVLDDPPARLPYWVVVVDELADLMMVSSKEIEGYITRLAQRSRAAGIHIILATQRPSVDVITGLIKANLPSRISFQVATKVDSRTILDRNGAEKLLGKGDMLFLPPGTSEFIRAQGAFVSEQEVAQVVTHVKNQQYAVEFEGLDDFLKPAGMDTSGPDGLGKAGEDALYEQAVEIILAHQRASVSLVQRRLQIGYNRAARLVEMMEEHGIVGPNRGSKSREILMTLEDWKTSKA